MKFRPKYQPSQSVQRKPLCLPEGLTLPESDEWLLSEDGKNYYLTFEDGEEEVFCKGSFIVLFGNAIDTLGTPDYLTFSSLNSHQESLTIFFDSPETEAAESVASEGELQLYETFCSPLPNGEYLGEFSSAVSPQEFSAGSHPQPGELVMLSLNNPVIQLMKLELWDPQVWMKVSDQAD